MSALEATGLDQVDRLTPAIAPAGDTLGLFPPGGHGEMAGRQ
jgi:hypothetical protein